MDDIASVAFPSADDKTALNGYLLEPALHSGRAPAVVLMHGRGGLYSSLADGVHSAATLTMRHRFWARFWAARGYLALLVDSFGPRGYPAGFGPGTADARPASVNEYRVRPFDAYGALAWLRSRPDVIPDRIGLQGWSNGGSAILAAMGGVGIADPTPETGFRAALAFYPACGLRHVFPAGYRPYAPLRILIGSCDEEVSPARCDQLVAATQAAGGPIFLHRYEGATHGFDDPHRRRQSLPENAAANADAQEQARRFFAEELRPDMGGKLT
jgi:dienelactone hydrolase